MWGFTRDEQRAILFLLFAFGAGVVMWWYRQQQPAPLVPPQKIAAFESMADSQRRDSSGFQSEPLTFSERSLTSKLTAAPLDLNTATYEELVCLPGIGPVLATRIVDYRKANGPFKKLDDLKKVKGIGVKTYNKLARHLIVK
ncbi:MAG: helix-hairpin-helix domain-containing protein [candidate division KSB1 bacterium]|nr:helix-hairpin-helix domain-containing protein [candidate division KSB1 bacterium]